MRYRTMTRSAPGLRHAPWFVALVLITFAAIAPRAEAAFPGRDGKLVFSVEGDILLANANGTGLEHLTSGPARDDSPSWSADGKLIVFVRNGVIHTMRANGRDLRSTRVSGRDPRWHPDRTLIVFWESEGVSTMRPDGHAVRLILKSEFAPFFFHTWRYPAWSVRGELLVSEAEADLEGTFSDVVPFDDCPFDAERAEWSPDGRMLAVMGFAAQICLTDGISGPEELQDVFATDVAWSPAGDRLAFGGAGALQIVDLEGNILRAFGFDVGAVDWQPVCTVIGTPGDDVISGTGGDDVICGLGGDDELLGLGGSDVIYAGSGNDYLGGGPGDDLLFGGFQVDSLFGHGGDDLLNGGPEVDRRCNGGSGTDRAVDCEVSFRVP
jgi:hypothetical protein